MHVVGQPIATRRATTAARVQGSADKRNEADRSDSHHPRAWRVDALIRPTGRRADRSREHTIPFWDPGWPARWRWCSLLYTLACKERGRRCRNNQVSAAGKGTARTADDGDGEEGEEETEWQRGMKVYSAASN
jgi:hypothetical protein